MHAGLQLSSSELSVPLGVSGAALMLWSLLVFPSVVKRIGARACALTGLYVSTLVPVALGSVSFLAAAHVPHGGILAALVTVQVVKACSQQLCFPTAMVRPPQLALLLVPLAVPCWSLCSAGHVQLMELCRQRPGWVQCSHHQYL